MFDINLVYKRLMSIKNNKKILFIASFLIYMLLSGLFVFLFHYKIRVHAVSAGIRPSFIWAVYVLCLIGLCTLYFIIAGLWMLIYKKHCPVEKIFIVVYLVFGLLYMFIIPPFGVNDEPMHYLKAYSVSQGRILAQGRNNGSCFVTLDRRDQNMLMTFAASANIENAQKYHNAFNILDNVKDNNSKQTVEVNMLSSVNSYSPFQYIFSGFGIAIGRLFHFNPIIIFYLGRLFNLLYFILIMYFAIKKLPILKTMFFCIALLPMTLQLAASYSGDCVLISLVMYYIASCLNLAFKKSEPERKEIIILTVVSGVIATFKLVYLPLCFLFLIIPKKKYANTKKYFITLGIMAGVSVVSWLSWMLITSRYITMSNVMSDAATIHANIGFIFSNTFNYLLIIFNTLADKMQFYINSMIGSYLGWLDIPVNFVLVYGFILLLIITAVNNVRNEKFNFTRIQKLIMFVISFSVIILILTSMFVTWTKTGSKCIQGVQGRYFIPVLPLILMLFRNKTFFVKKSIDKAVILTACILQIITIINISSVITRV